MSGTPESPERYALNTARTAILKAANGKRDPSQPPYNTRQINEAVCCVRHHHLIDEGTLRTAGFRAKRRER